jgi:prepilin-type N-terminal cleavage/methylation domain-containing protein
MKSKKMIKNLKGMTLVEIIIAMAVLAIAGSVMCTACSFVAKMKITTNALTKRVSYEAPIADCKMYYTYDEDGNKVSSYAVGAGTTEYKKDIKDDAGNVTGSKTCNSTLTVSDGTNSYSIDGYLYQANYSGLDYGNSDGLVDTSNHNFKFFVIGGIDNDIKAGGTDDDET